MSKSKNKSHYIIPVFVPDLGCPHQCVFCNQKKITGQNTVPSGDNVTETIADYLKTIPNGDKITKEVAFYGGSFTAVDKNLQKELLAPAYRFLASGQIDRIRVSTRPDSVDEEKLALLSGYGVDIIELGVQSMDDEVLAKAGRGHTSRDVLRAAALIKEWGMELGFQVIIGLPGDTPDKETNTALELIGLKPDMVRIYPCLVLKGTELAAMYEKGDYFPLTVDEAVIRCKKLLVMFENAGINVIRIGLQPSESINLEGEVLAGPYHPAFRELVESSLARDLLDYLLTDKLKFGMEHVVEVAVPEQDVSVIRGHKGANAEYLKEKYLITDFRTTVDNSLKRGAIRLLTVDGRSVEDNVNRARLSLGF